MIASYYCINNTNPWMEQIYSHISSIFTEREAERSSEKAVNDDLVLSSKLIDSKNNGREQQNV